MTWVSFLVFGHGDGRKDTGSSGFRSMRTFIRLLGLAFATGGRGGRIDFGTYGKFAILLRFGGRFPGRFHYTSGRGFGGTTNGFVTTESTVYGRFTTTSVYFSFHVSRTNGLGSVVNLGGRSDDFVDFYGMFSRFGRWFPI